MRWVLVLALLVLSRPVQAIPPEPPWLFAHIDHASSYLAGWALNCETGQQPSALRLTSWDGADWHPIPAWVIWRLPRPDVAAAFARHCGPLKPYLGWHLYPLVPLPSGTYRLSVSDGYFSGIERDVTIP